MTPEQRAQYWKQRAKSAEGHLLRSDVEAGAREIHRLARSFSPDMPDWHELKPEQRENFRYYAMAVVSEINKRRHDRRPSYYKDMI